MDFLQKESIDCLRQWIAQSRKCAVVTHTHPDGDALGSSAALALYLQAQGKDAVVVLPEDPAENLRFILPEGLPWLSHEKAPQDAEKAVAGADFIILADANAFSRTEALEPALKASKARKVLMDHHLNPDRDSFQLVFSTPDISSASELVFWVLRELMGEGSFPPISGHPRPDKREGPVIGAALLTGMTTDTNNFANSVYPSTLQMASELLAAGVDRDAILQQLYASYRENRVRLMGYMQSEQLHVLGEAAYMILTKDIQHRFDLKEGESEGLVNVPLSIGAVRLSVLLKEDKGHFRVSVRSKKGTSAQQLAVTYFHGGGHENAAGGKLFIGADIPSPADAPAYVEQALKEFLK